MARIRAIKPGFFRDADLFDAEQRTGLPLRVAYAGLWTIADREGRFKWRPREVKPEVLPHDAVDMGEVLTALEQCGKLQRYSVDGNEYGFIISFLKHQHINKKESASTIPAPDENRKSRAKTVKAPDKEGGERKGREGKEDKLSADADDYSFQKFWSGYPTDKNMSRKAAQAQWDRLPLDKRKAAIAALPGFRAYCAANGWYRPKHADGWLAQERFEGYASEGNLKPVEVDAVRAGWDGAAGQLIDALGENGLALFRSWFGEAKFEPGPQPRVIFPKEFQRRWVSDHPELSRPLQQVFPEVVLEVAA